MYLPNTVFSPLFQIYLGKPGQILCRVMKRSIAYEEKQIECNELEQE